MRCITLAAAHAKHGGPLYENPIIFLSMPDYCSDYWRTFYYLLLEYETMKTETFDYQTRMECEQESAVTTDEFDNGLWLSISVHGASARAILTREQALSLIDNINIALDAKTLPKNQGKP